jgi:hypothetical protein
VAASAMDGEGVESSGCGAVGWEWWQVARTGEVVGCAADWWRCRCRRAPGTVRGMTEMGKGIEGRVARAGSRVAGDDVGTGWASREG